MTNLNNDTTTIYNTTTIPAFDASSVSIASNISSGTAAGDTITLTGSVGGYGAVSSNLMYTNSNSGSLYIHNGIAANTWSNSTWTTTSYGTPFVDKFPEWNAFRQLCEDYPGLEKAYENLKTFYTICYEDSLLPKETK